ncbi:MAG: D-alanyl-D-alanine carboxypeptidase family protein [Clostridia bacterium]
MKKFLCFFYVICLFLGNLAFAEESIPIELSSPSAILLDTSGNIIFEKNSHDKREPASVTKIMTLLLTLEAIEDGKIDFTDIVTISELAASQGGTQVYLETGEQISVEELIKSVAVSSANDAATALGEYISGSREAFVELMNQRASELGMVDTTFKNPTGLHEDGHETSAYDIALMSVELLKHDVIYSYTTIWMDSIRDGEFELANTNKLLKTYDGMTGLKTGFTSEAMYCISAVANRDGQEFLAVVMGAETSDLRSADICKMLDYGFLNYKTQTLIYEEKLPEIIVLNGEQDSVEIEIKYTVQDFLLNINSEITYEVKVEEELSAPIELEQKVGEIAFKNGEEELLRCDIVTKNEVSQLTFKTSLTRFLYTFFMKN